MIPNTFSGTLKVMNFKILWFPSAMARSTFGSATDNPWRILGVVLEYQVGPSLIYQGAHHSMAKVPQRVLEVFVLRCRPSFAFTSLFSSLEWQALWWIKRSRPWRANGSRSLFSGGSFLSFSLSLLLPLWFALCSRALRKERPEGSLEVSCVRGRRKGKPTMN